MWRWVVVAGIAAAWLYVGGRNADLRAQARQPATLVITGGTVITMDDARRVLAPGAVAVAGTDIVGVGTPADVAARFSAAETIDATGQVVLPGLINTHTHAPMVLYRGLGNDLNLQDWLTKYIFPAEGKTVSPEFVRAGTRLAALEMILGGTTTFVDMYYFEEEVAEATREAGLRGVLGQTLIQFPVADAKTPEEGLARTRAFVARYKSDTLVTPAVAPHSTYTLSAATLQAADRLAREQHVPLLIHLEETRTEREDSLKARGLTPTAYLAKLGLLGRHLLGAHGVWLGPDDIRLVAEAHASISHNPESNMKLASGVAPVGEYVAAGVAIGLGTDGAASNNDLDMFEAMRQAAFLQKVTRGDPTTAPATLVLEMATRRGAEAIGMGDRLGQLTPGRRADVIVVDTRAPHLQPMFDPIAQLVYAAKGSDVRTTIVNGRVLMHDRVVKTLQAPAVLGDAQKMAERVRAAVR
ncbi:5-methylthioadenosine/S-adenosylhomocysteine deaminase [Luteitalea pratensis]|uniref:5-methylthioadenosine/S-adenosylhomocysteine deaminase n=1 Tax=Luteitalea pratensis TaxID=1855912 RepID=A0A143PNN7_LUTPR|nr:amidohydrolase [Luteitalea pratensis]AMY10026.1 5-methylthioadenosine/S-adenosylhomocysteine deaminase [Luteitalea pratensis]